MWEKWGHRANHCSQVWKDQQTDTENHKLPEHGLRSWSSCGNQGRGRRTWTVTDEALEAVWTLTGKHPGEPRHWEPLPCCEFYLVGLYQVLTANIREKFPRAYSRRREKEWFKYARALDSQQCVPSGEIIWPEPAGLVSEPNWSKGREISHCSPSVSPTSWHSGDGIRSSVLRGGEEGGMNKWRTEEF